MGELAKKYGVPKKCHPECHQLDFKEGKLYRVKTKGLGFKTNPDSESPQITPDVGAVIMFLEYAPDPMLASFSPGNRMLRIIHEDRTVTFGGSLCSRHFEKVGV